MAVEFDPSERMNRTQAAVFLGLSVQTLAVDATSGLKASGRLAIPFVKAGGKHVHYYKSQLIAWLQARQRNPVEVAK